MRLLRGQICSVTNIVMKKKVSCYRQTDAVQHLLQGFGFGFGSAGVTAAVFPPGWGALVRQEVDVDEFKGAHLVVELPRPRPHGGLLDDVNDVTFL